MPCTLDPSLWSINQFTTIHAMHSNLSDNLILISYQTSIVSLINPSKHTICIFNQL